MAERITIEKMKALEAEYEVTIPEEIKKLLCEKWIVLEERFI